MPNQLWLFMTACLCFQGLTLDAPAQNLQNLLGNGSFEEVSTNTTRWNTVVGGILSTQAVHSGQRGLRGAAPGGARVWVSDPISLQPRQIYRLDGWLRGHTGEATLGIDLLDKRGRRVGSRHAPDVKEATDWQYLAREWNAGRATSARVWFWVEGHADLDDVSVELRGTRPKAHRVEVRINQAGFAQEGPKSALIAANFFPWRDSIARVRLLNKRGRTVWTQDTPCAGRIQGENAEDGGWYFWRADFASVQGPGTYRIKVALEKARGTSPAFSIGSATREVTPLTSQ